MRKYLLYILIFFFGAIIGLITSLLILDRYHIKFSEVNEIAFLSDIEELSFKIYKTGDYESTLVILKYLDDKLKVSAVKPKNSILSKNNRIDRGILHGRLYMLFKSKNESKLALDEYNNAVQLLGDEYNINSEDELKNIIISIDSLQEEK